jgi:hypothetical protein
MQPETAIKNSILRLIQLHPKRGMAWSQYNGAVFDQRRGFYRKPSRWYRKGVPDIIGIWDGKPLFIEVKTETGKVSSEQKQFLEDATSHGALAFVARSYQEVKEKLLI